MGLRDLTFPTVDVETSGGPLAVRGLSLDHIMGLFYRHREDVTALYDSLIAKRQGGANITNDDTTVIALRMIASLPTVVAEIIALATGANTADADEFTAAVGIAQTLLSVGEQLDAIEKIAAQTFTSEMPPGKILALVRQAMQAGTNALASPPAPAT